MNWNYGDLFDEIAARVPERTALIQGDLTRSWKDMDARTNRLARALLDVDGVSFGDKVALYSRNSPAYIEGTIAAFKSRLVHVNVNYRYVDEELAYVLGDCDAAVLIYSSEFADRVAQLKDRLAGIKVFVEVSDGAPVNTFARSFEDLAETGDGTRLDVERSPDDLFFLYTGGTTGRPKGVMWRHEDRIGVFQGQEAASPDAYIENALTGEPRIHLPCCPLMHSTGLTSSVDTLLHGGAVMTLPSGSLHADVICKNIDRYGVTSLAIVGDAVGRPLVDYLAQSNGALDMSSVRLVLSAGVMWSESGKKEILRIMPNAILMDSFGSSEGSGLGSSQTTREGVAETGKFKIGANCKVFTEDHQEVVPGSGVPGLIAKSGNIPLGYYKDPERSARTFPTIDGVRYSLPGDWCLVEEDGSIRLLGRGSGCINTGGEKVFAEEVEEVLKGYDGVRDVLVVGIPDPRWGQAVAAVVQSDTTTTAFDGDKLRAYARGHMADYKIPKKIAVIENSLRLPNGKPDYDLAKETLAASS